MAKSVQVVLLPITFFPLFISFFSLLFHCRYAGSSIQALVTEVEPVPPPLPVAVLGPIRVGLYLGNGQCITKGCVEGRCEGDLS